MFDFAYCVLGTNQVSNPPQPNCRLPADKPLPPPVIAVGGVFGNVSNPPQPRRLLAFYCRMDLVEPC